MTAAGSHGPAWEKDGVRFNLWAPSAQTVDLILNGGPRAMNKDGDGWFSVAARDAKAGDRYLFDIDKRIRVPDPASRFQPEGVNGPSELRDNGFNWNDKGWRNRPWADAVIYELHIGTFSPEGTYKGALAKLDHLAALGVTAIELLPLSSFAGQRGWGYDGVLPYAPHAAYGSPEDLKALIDAAHQRNLMVFLDVVYNHFGPAGNFLHEYAKPFFTDKYQTPWGSAIAYEGNTPVRDFMIENALYWLRDFHFDGLRFDAVHAIYDASPEPFLQELARRIRAAAPGAHLILENDRNQAGLLPYDGNGPRLFSAQWNDDIHHEYHVLLTGERDGYYQNYTQDTLARLGRCLTQGYDYQGEKLPQNGEPRGEPSAHLPPAAFISFLQNHDQIGNRAKGDRLATLIGKEKSILALGLLLLAPQPPMLFMGEEWGAETPFLYFCDFEGELAHLVKEGRRAEFKHFPAFADPEQRAAIPDPNALDSFAASRLNWDELAHEHHGARLAFVRHLLALRQSFVTPLIVSGWVGSAYRLHGQGGIAVDWTFNAGKLHAVANFSDAPIDLALPQGAEPIWGASGGQLPPWKSNVGVTHG